MKKINSIYPQLSRTVIGTSLLLTSNIIWAQDNPKPVSWKNITVVIQQTYGNNQSRLLRGARVTLALENPQKASGLSLQSRKPRLPQTKTSGSRGANFSKMPPSNLVGDYIIKVEPRDKACGEQVKKVSHSTRQKRVQFNFSCNGQSRTTKNVVNLDTNTCHQVRINSQGAYARSHKPVSVEACPGADGLWVIQPFSY